MATYLAVPLKRTWEVDLIKPIKKFIADTYGTDNESDYNNALQEFCKLRGNIITKSVDKHESALEVLYRFVPFVTVHVLYTYRSSSVSSRFLFGL